MQDYTNPYIRLQTYYSLLANNDSIKISDDYDYGVPIKWIHQVTQIPLEIIRNDIIVYFKWQCNLIENVNLPSEANNEINFDFESTEYQKANKKYNIDEISQDKLYLLLENGKLDDIPLIIDNTNQDSFSIYLNPNETQALNHYYSTQSKHSNELSSLNNSFKKNYKIKDSFRYSYLSNNIFLSLNEMLLTINEAIENQEALQIRFRDNKNIIHNYIFIPLKISYDSRDNQYRIIASYDDKAQIYPLNQILAIQRHTSGSKIKSSNSDFLKYASQVWGNNFRETPESVKVKFYNEGNIWNKVKSELKSRQDHNPDFKLYEDNGYLYYEDKVYGMNAFKSWILGYGRSAIVLKPQKLIDEIILSLKARQSYYENL